MAAAPPPPALPVWSAAAARPCPVTTDDTARRRLAPAIASLLVHATLAGAIALAAAWLPAADLARGGETAIDVEIVVVGPQDAQASAESRATPEPDRATEPDAPLPPPILSDLAPPALPEALVVETEPPPPPETPMPALPDTAASLLPDVLAVEAERPVMTRSVAAQGSELAPMDLPAPQPPAADTTAREVTPPPQRQAAAPAPARPRERRTPPVRQPAAPAPAAASLAAQRGGTAGAAETAGRAEASSYAATVMSHLARHKRYPDAVRWRGDRGIVTITFTVDRAGRLGGLRLAAGSGSAALDEAALAMARRAEPFPPPPADLGRASMRFTAPIRFDLRDR